MNPTAYREANDLIVNSPTPSDLYHWDNKAVAAILERMEYLGHTVDFKFTKKSYKSNTGTCGAHFIRAVVLEKLVLEHPQRTAQYVQAYEDEFVEKIFVYAPDKSSGKRVQLVEISYNCVGVLELPEINEKDSKTA